MSTAGPRAPGAATAPSWTNPNNALSDDANFAETTTTAAVLDLTNYGFTVPAGSTINGITVALHRKGTSSKFGGVKDQVIQLLIGGSPLGDNKSDMITKWPTSEGTATYGGSSDKWGLTPTVDNVNAAGFGFRVQPMIDPAMTAYVDVALITITYTEGSGAAGLVTRRAMTGVGM